MAIKLQIFTIKKIPKVDSNHICLVAVILDSVLKKDDSHYPQVFLNECKYIRKKLIRDIIDNLSDFSSTDESDQE